MDEILNLIESVSEGFPSYFLIKRQLLLFFSIKTYIMTPHMAVTFLYFFHALKMIQSALDRKEDNRVT